MGSPFLSIASLAVDIPIWAIASDDRIQSLGAVFAFEALPMPRATPSQHFFSGEDYAATARTTLSWGSLDLGRIDNGSLRRLLAICNWMRLLEERYFEDKEG